MPSELRGLNDIQIDWLYYGIVEKFKKQAETLKNTEGALEFSSLQG